MADRYAVFGNPIKHSKSPQIHMDFAAQTGEVMEYSTQLVDKGLFADTAMEFFIAGGCGLNITVPFKLDAYEFADDLSHRARQAEAVNTLVKQPEGTIMGDNTDGIGLVRDIIENHRIRIAGRNILLLGAGGAARGVMGPLLDEQPQSLTVANRTVSKGERLAAQFAALGKTLACGFDGLAKEKYDLVINATAASLSDELPPLPDDLLASDAFCYDMMYGAKPTVFQQWAASHGAAQTVDGLGMLVEQAAESFYIWRGKRPDTSITIQTIRTELNA